LTPPRQSSTQRGPAQVGPRASGAACGAIARSDRGRQAPPVDEHPHGREHRHDQSGKLLLEYVDGEIIARLAAPLDTPDATRRAAMVSRCWAVLDRIVATPGPGFALLEQRQLMMMRGKRCSGRAPRRRSFTSPSQKPTGQFISC
jgi:hypothetical protein